MKDSLIIGLVDGANYLKQFFQILFLTIYPNKKIIMKLKIDKEPDFLVYSTSGEEHKKYKNCYKILINTKSANLKNYNTNLIIDTTNDVTHLPEKVNMVYIPYYVISFYERFRNVPNSLIKSSEYNSNQILQSKKNFCAFLYYNCDIKYRIKFFHILSQYKKVDPLGKCLNKNKECDRFYFKDGQMSYLDLAVSKYKPYKFVICFESKNKKGYISEKIVNAMLANAIPIYSGSNEIIKHFNKKAFINSNDFKTFEELSDYIKKLDNDDNLYKKMLQEPWFENNKLPNWFSIGLFSSVIKNLIKQKQSEM